MRQFTTGPEVREGIRDHNALFWRGNTLKKSILSGTKLDHLAANDRQTSGKLPAHHNLVTAA
jgi:hypothetical protein